MALTPENLETLRHPFAPEDHEWLRGFVYLTEEAITNRIDEIDPSWSLEILDSHMRASEIGQQVVTTVRLTIGGVARSGVGMQATHYLDTKDNKIKEAKSEAEKGAATDALKRAARLFGIGRYLLGAPNQDKFNSWLAALSGQPAPKLLPASASDAQPKVGTNDADTFGKLVDGIFGNREHGRNAFKKLMDMKVLNKKSMSQDEQLTILRVYHELRTADTPLAPDADGDTVRKAIADFRAGQRVEF